MLIAPAPAGGLTTSGRPTSAAKPRAPSTEPTSAWRATGSPAARSTSFMRVLVAEVLRDRGVHARHAQRLAGLGDGYLQLLEDRQEALDRATRLRGQAAHGGHELLGVERVVDPPMGHGELADAWRQVVGRAVRDDRECDARQTGGALDEPGGRLQQVRGDESGEFDHGFGA